MDETAKGPTAGELVLFCRHADVLPDQIRLIRRFHWYFMGGETAVRVEDGSSFNVSWLAICDDCNRIAAENPDVAVELAEQDAKWIGETPNITPLLEKAVD